MSSSNAMTTKPVLLIVSVIIATAIIVTMSFRLFVPSEVPSQSDASMSLSPSTSPLEPVAPHSSQNSPASFKTTEQAIVHDTNGSHTEGSPVDALTNDIVARLAKRLETEYGAKIHLLPVQANLFSVRTALLDHYPEHGLSYFNQAIAIAFPEYEQGIHALMELIALYRQWLLENDEALASLSTDEYDKVVYEKRIEIFGDHAQKLWHDHDLSPDQIAAKQHIKSLDTAHEMDYYERLYQLSTTMYESFDNTFQFAQLTPVSVAGTFFNLSSVQQDLANLEPSERQNVINETRARLGFSEQELAYFEQRDQKRNARWDNGKAYMKERAKLVDSLNGDELETALDALRERYFKHEKDTFAKEEATGFFRYNRPRMYGLN